MNEATPHRIVSALMTNQYYDGHQTLSLSRGRGLGTRLDQGTHAMWEPMLCGNPCYVGTYAMMEALRLEMSSQTPTLVHASLYMYVSLSLSTFPSISLPPSLSCPLTCLYLYTAIVYWATATILLHRNINSYEQLHTHKRYVRLSAFIPACQILSLATPCRSSPSIIYRSWTTCLMLHKTPSNYGLMQSKTDSSQYSIGTLDTHTHTLYSALC